jgi:hypothetical protein
MHGVPNTWSRSMWTPLSISVQEQCQTIQLGEPEYILVKCIYLSFIPQYCCKLAQILRHFWLVLGKSLVRISARTPPFLIEDGVSLSVPQLRRLVAGFPPPWLGLYLRSSHVGSVAKKGALWQVFSEYFSSACQFSFYYVCMYKGWAIKQPMHRHL